jgi:Zn-dependent protease
VRDDILTSVAGPVSNLITAFVSIVILAFIVHGSDIVIGNHMRGASTAEALATLFYDAMWINVVLAVFNLIPLPPLDGSHVIRHFLSYDTQRVYDRFGYGALIVVLFILPMIGFNLVGIMIAPFMYFYQALLAVFLGFR